MKEGLTHLPDDRALCAGLASVLAIGGKGIGLTVVERTPNPHASTFPSEVVTCRIGDGELVRLLCKYGGHEHAAFGHRGGVAYEADVYRCVLAAATLPVPRFYGAAATGPAGEVWLAVAYVTEAQRLNDSRDLSLWERAAAWSGRFHAEHEKRGQDPSFSFLIDYDGAYYAGWARRTVEYAATMDLNLPWLADLCRRAEAVLCELLDAPRAVIHGEYYPRNILAKDGTIYPVDWESAARAPGEIDLATLTDRCSPDVVDRCEAAYRVARWPGGAPQGFTRTLDVARLYVHLRWLGATAGPKFRRRLWRFGEVRALGERLSLV